MPDIFFMFVLFIMLIVIWGGLMVLYVIDKFTELGKMSILTAGLAYVFRRVRK